MSTTDSRDRILARIRAAHFGDTAMPRIPMFTVPGDPKDNFRQKLASFDGRSEEFATRADALRWLSDKTDHAQRRIYSALPDFSGNVERSYVEADPHRAHEVDICVAEGEYGVGETGSVWLTDRALGVPACALLCTDLYLLLDSSRILPDMHRAYATAGIGSTPYGSFFTGPSATADIEAVRITGAQGEISLTVLIYG